MNYFPIGKCIDRVHAAMDQVYQCGTRVHEPLIKPLLLNSVPMALIKRTKRYPMVLVGAVNTKMSSGGLFHRRRWRCWVSTAVPWPSVVARQSGGWGELQSTTSSGSELKSKRRSRGSHKVVFRATAITGRWCATVRLQLLSSIMVGGSSKGQNRPGLHQTGPAQCRQARRAVTVAQHTVEWLGFSSVFAKIPHEGSPIDRGFAPRLCGTRIQP
jgi:hypothetical protein